MLNIKTLIGNINRYCRNNIPNFRFCSLTIESIYHSDNNIYIKIYIYAFLKDSDEPETFSLDVSQDHKNGFIMREFTKEMEKRFLDRKINNNEDSVKK